MRTYIVIGAGVLGASTAYHLAKAGAMVTLVDRRDVGQATDAAAGIVCPWLSQRRNKAWYQLARNGARYYHALIKELEEAGETDTGYLKVGALSLHTDEKKLEQMEERAYKRLEDAPEIGEITRLSPAEAQRHYPPLADSYGAVHISGAARVNGRELRDALIRATQKLGGLLMSGHAQLVVEQNTVLGVNVGGSFLEADRIIITAGAWGKDSVKELGYDFKVVPQKAQILHLKMPQTDTNHWPVIMPPTNQYLLSFGEGRIVVGATHEDEMGFDSRVTAGGVQEILSKMLEVAPGLMTSTFVEARVGFRPFTPGFLPVFGALPTHQEVLLANGLGASGLTAGPYLGSQLANLALGEALELKPEDYPLTEALERIEF
ncbi:NAD(P)/FAD-dependent oxidoreductase [Bacillus horti]|uniref:D-amino-acid dehydrogenase n=1 Tax=Caldalkalibacillus horti TaxID=77523 RepID=A0ABT9VYE0_9BACI|nr:FAD-dependent oxidoreductase [Bacillus horti]MDQ0166014.1 D-amino-acid dehydrogenase [Bacillus horti]